MSHDNLFSYVTLFSFGFFFFSDGNNLYNYGSTCPLCIILVSVLILALVSTFQPQNLSFNLPYIALCDLVLRIVEFDLPSRVSTPLQVIATHPNPRFLFPRASRVLGRQSISLPFLVNSPQQQARRVLHVGRGRAESRWSDGFVCTLPTISTQLTIRVTCVLLVVPGCCGHQERCLDRSSHSHNCLGRNVDEP